MNPQYRTFHRSLIQNAKNGFILNYWSSLHWLVLGFLYAISVQWSIFATSYPIPTPPPQPLSLPPHTFWVPKVFFYAQTQCSIVTRTHISKRYFPLLFAGKNPDNFHTVKLTHPMKCFFHSPLYSFRLTLTSQIESIRCTQYTPLYWKGVKE